MIILILFSQHILSGIGRLYTWTELSRFVPQWAGDKACVASSSRPVTICPHAARLSISKVAFILRADAVRTCLEYYAACNQYVKTLNTNVSECQVVGSDHGL